VVRRTLKTVVNGACLILALPAAILSLFGRVEPLYLIFAHCYAMLPGLPGDYLRIAFYRLTLQECSLASRVSFGAFFAHREATVAPGVYIGPYCVLGRVMIGERTQIASGVQVLSGRHQHVRDAAGRISGSLQGDFTQVVIGADCWIGAATVVMADVGARCTVGAGSVVSRPIPSDSVAVGSPARVIRNTGTSPPDPVAQPVA
jgi:acetyltransferase-like isoleucine patch superfamily enzyme